MPALLMKLMGLSEGEMGMTYMLYGMLGLLLGGWATNLLLRVRTLPEMMQFCLSCQVILCMGLFALCQFHSLAPYVGCLVFMECTLQGVLSTLSTLWLMAETDDSIPAFGFSLWYGLSAAGRVIVGPLAVLVIHMFGWSAYIMVGAIIALGATIAANEYFRTQELVIYT